MDDRFAGLEREYDFLLQVFPEYSVMQNRVGRIVAEFVAQSRMGSRLPLVFEGGCGTGLTSAAILSHTPEMCLHASDINGEMVRLTQQRLAEQFPRGTFLVRLGDFEEVLAQMPVKVDVVVSAHTIHNIPQPDRVDLFRMIRARLREGGLFVNLDKIWLDEQAHDEAVFAAWLARYERFRELGRPDLCTVWQEHEQEDMANQLTVKEQLRLFQIAGLTPGRIEREGPLSAIFTAIKPA